MNDNNTIPSFASEDAIDLKEIFQTLWRKKVLIIVVNSAVVILTAIATLMMPNVYRSETRMIPADESKGGGLAALASQFGGLASLAGINLSENATDKSVVALEILTSRAFINKFIKERNIAVDLVAAKGWDRENDTLVIDSELYNITTKEWVRDVSYPQSVTPSEFELYEEFREVFFVINDTSTGFVTLAMESYSPTIAKQWLELIVNDINDYMRERDIAIAETSIEYLEEQVSKNTFKEMEPVFYQLIQEQIKTIMLAKSRKEYVFQVIDPSFVPEEKHSPKRFLIVFLLAVFSSALSVVFVLMKYSNKS